MSQHLTIPRLGSPRVNQALVDLVRKIKGTGSADGFYTSAGGRRYRVTRKSDADLYKRMMRAKGLVVQVGEP